MKSSNSEDVGSFDHIWERGLSKFQKELDPQIFSAFIKPLKFSSYDSSTSEVTIRAPSKFVCTQVDKKFRGSFLKMFSDELGASNLSIRFAVDESVSALDKSKDSAGVLSKNPYVVVKRVGSNGSLSPVGGSGSPSNDLLHYRSNPKYTFQNFVVGNSNQFSHAAACRVAEEPGASYNPLFIYGGVGLGKTHLLHAIGNAVLEKNPRKRVCYISSETFTNELIQALRHAKMDEFKKRFRSIDVLLVDDIQFICGKERTQEEFFHTFNVLYNLKHQIVITSDKIPQEIHGLEERLQTRFSWGLAADLQAPDFETRVAILRRKASLESFLLPEDVAGFVAEKFSSNIRELEGALTRLRAASLVHGVNVDLKVAAAALKPLLQPKAVNLSIDDIKKAVANHFNLKTSEIVSKRRTKNLSFPRHIAMYLCRKHTTCSYPEIGQEFGGRDHSSVIHAANVVGEKMKSEEDLKVLILGLEKKLFG